MLTKFAVTNYKNFRDRTELDFTKKGGYKFNTKCVNEVGLSKMILMGPNGSGKTNFGYALFDIVYTLTDKPAAELQTEPTSFICGNGTSRYATFEYEFLLNGRRIRYQYSKSEPFVIVAESLEIEGKPVFTYDLRKKVKFTGDLALIGAEALDTSRFNGPVPISILRLIANNTQQKRGSIVDRIMDFVGRMLYFRCLGSRKFIGFSNYAEYLEPYFIKEGLVEDFEEYLREMAQLDVQLKVVKTPGLPDLLVQKYENKVLPFGMVASSGTKALELFYYWNKRFRKVSFLFVDEFDAFYHFELAERVIKLVISGYEEMQAIFTSHNTDLVSNDLMRPDCYLIIGPKGVRSLTESTCRELRQGHNLEKMYRNGEFDNDGGESR